MLIFVRSFKTCEVSIFIIFLNLILFCLQRSEVKFQVSLVAQKRTRTKKARLRWVYFNSSGGNRNFSLSYHWLTSHEGLCLKDTRRHCETTTCACITLFCTFLCRHCTTKTWNFLISRFLVDYEQSLFFLSPVERNARETEMKKNWRDCWQSSFIGGNSLLSVNFAVLAGVVA